MKKFVVLLVVVAMTCFSAVAFAADLSVSGSIDIRSRSFRDLDLNKDLNAYFSKDTTDTQERVRLNVDAKAGDVKGRISIENDWDNFGRLEAKQANASTATGETSGIGASILDLREAWINFNVPGIPVNVNVGHQLLKLGNGWFLRNMKYGDDAWVVANVTGNNTVAFVDIKAAELNAAVADDIDGYALLDVFKVNDDMTVGIDITDVKDRTAAILNNLPGANFKNMDLQNVGLNFNGKFGIVNVMAELDFQMGKAKGAVAGAEDLKFKGNQLVVQGDVALDPVKVNFTVASGSGDKSTPSNNDVKTMLTILDGDPHYTLLYEYQIGQPNPIPAGGNGAMTALGGTTHFGFANTTALNVGVSTDATKGLNVGVDLWYLQATEKINNGEKDTNALGTEIDAHVNWAMYDNLSWNWKLGYFMPGDAYKVGGKTADKASGVQGILSFKF